MIVSSSLRLRSRVADSAVREHLKGRVLSEADYDVLLTGPTRVSKPDGSPLAVYLPGALAAFASDPTVYEVLHGLKAERTTNRGTASGTVRFRNAHSTSSGYALGVPSAIIGAMDPNTRHKFCRLTAWTGQHLPEWEQLQPLLAAIAGHFAEQVPGRYAAQQAQAALADPAWIIPGTPFSTVTVNNTYPTGVHQDAGDLAEGFSTIACLRRGTYTGGQLVFPAYRVAVSMGDGDLLLMDAHDWHGNVPIVCSCGSQLNGPCTTCAAERISLVSYFRAGMPACGSPEAERDRAAAQHVRQGRSIDSPTASTPVNANP